MTSATMDPPTDEADADRVDLESKLAELQKERDKFRDQLNSVSGWKHKMTAAQNSLAKAQAAYEEADARRKAAKANVDKKIAENMSLVAKFVNGEMLLPYDPPEGEEPPPLQQTTDEFGLVSLTAAKATVDGKPKKLPKGFVEKMESLEPPVTNVKELEALLGSGKLQRVNGVGETMIDKVSDWIMAYRQEHPIPAEPEPAGDDTDAFHQEAVAMLEKLLADAHDLAHNGPPDGIEFAESVTTEATGVLETIRETGTVTDAQMEAIANWQAGVAKWMRG